MYRLNTFFSKCHKSLPLVMASICGHYMYEHIRHNDTITTKSDPNFTIKALITIRNARLVGITAIGWPKADSIVSVATTHSYGTGFVVDSSGLIVTNCHVVRDYQYMNVMLWKPLTRAQLFDKDQSLEKVYELDGQVVYAEPELDLALVRVFVKHNSLPALTLSTRTNITAGETVLVYGNPGFPGLVAGLVVDADCAHPVDVNRHDRPILNAYSNQTGDRFLKHSAPTVVGFSGGPVLDESLDVIGVHFCSTKVGDGIATKAIDVQKFLERAETYEGLRPESQEYAMGKNSLGVVLSRTPGGEFKVSDHGIDRWANVSDEKQRLLTEDVITHIDGTPLASFEQLEETLERHVFGHPLKVRVKRGRVKDMEILVTPLIDDHNCSFI